jgi:hypothetical protein
MGLQKQGADQKRATVKPRATIISTTPQQESGSRNGVTSLCKSSSKHGKEKAMLISMGSDAASVLYAGEI